MDRVCCYHVSNLHETGEQRCAWIERNQVVEKEVYTTSRDKGKKKSEIGDKE